MTKKELLEIIQDAPDDTEIFIEDAINFYCEINSIELVEISGTSCFIIQTGAVI